jgi:glutamate synthase domain-containing protein 1
MMATNLSTGKPREACGIVGIWGKEASVKVAPLCYLGLYALQHRGQESAGMVLAWSLKSLTKIDLLNYRVLPGSVMCDLLPRLKDM